MPEGHVKYNRVLLKLSGEALMGDQSFGIDPDMVATLPEKYQIFIVWASK